MTLQQSFEVVEPIVKRVLPGHPYAPAWCSMWLEQHNVATPTEAQVRAAISAFKKRITDAGYEI